MSSKKKNLDVYLGEVFKQYIAIKDDDYKKSQEVFKGVFDQMKAKMGEKCNYFGKYSSQVLYAGSVYDGIKVSKLDEFDMDIVIRLPINYDEGITIENDHPGFVKLKILDAFDHLDKQQDWEKCHKVTRDWRDNEKYFLQNKFRQWMHGIVQKALNDLNGTVTVNGVTYLVKYKESGPAYTLNIENTKGNEEFKLDVDLVPVIRFMYPRWPEGYRTVDESVLKDWLVVPKPNKSIPNGIMKNRCWRLSFQDFERELMKGCQQLKTTIRLVKKLRDSLQMKDIASYYIKTLFLWKIHETKEKKYWQKGLGVIFRIMVEDLYNAIKNNNIPYFWHPDNNLIANLKPTVQKLYEDKLKEVLDAIDSNDVDKIVCRLLTTAEYQEFKQSDFYQKQSVLYSSGSSVLSPQVYRQDSNASLPSYLTRESPKCELLNNDLTIELLKEINDKLNIVTENKGQEKAGISDAKLDVVVDMLNTMQAKVNDLSNTIKDQNEILKKIDKVISEKDEFCDKINDLLDKINIQNEFLKKMDMFFKKTQETNKLIIEHNQIRLEDESSNQNRI